MCIVKYAQDKCQAYSVSQSKFVVALFTSKNDSAESIAAHVLNHHSASSNNRWFSGGCTSGRGTRALGRAVWLSPFGPRTSSVRAAPAVIPSRISASPANHRYDNTSKSLSLFAALRQMRLHVHACIDRTASIRFEGMLMSFVFFEPTCSGGKWCRGCQSDEVGGRLSRNRNHRHILPAKYFQKYLPMNSHASTL